MLRIVLPLIYLLSASVFAQDPVYTLVRTQVYDNADTASRIVYTLEPRTALKLFRNYTPEWDIVDFNGERGFARHAALSTDPVVLFPKDPETGLIHFSEVIQAPGVSDKELYNRARDWFTTHYRSVEFVATLQVDDWEAGKLTGNARIPVVLNPQGGLSGVYSLYHLVRVQVKEGRFKYEVTNFTHSVLRGVSTDIRISVPLEGFMARKGINKTWVVRTHQEVSALIASLKKAMATPAGGKDDW